MHMTVRPLAGWRSDPTLYTAYMHAGSSRDLPLSECVRRSYFWGTERGAFDVHHLGIQLTSDIEPIV